MIELSLHDYLSIPRDLTDTADTEPFRNVIKIGDLVIANRNDARRHLQNRVGQRIYAGRRLKNEGQSAVTIRRISGSPDDHLLGDDRSTAILQVDTFTKGPGSFLDASIISELLRIAITRYRGNWGRATSAFVGTAQLERSSINQISPRDGTEYWTHRASFDYQINYIQNLVEV